MNLADVKQVYFVGIGGIGMSAIARWFNAQGVPVSGYDRTPTVLTKALEAEGIRIHFEDAVAQIDELVRTDKAGSLIIYTPAIPKDHRELNYFRQEGYVLKKRSEVLGMITAHHFTVAVAGTHGKTTTSSMVAHLLHEAGLNCAAFLGGIATNFQSNLLLAPRPQEPQVVVVEADEYDRSFLTLHPDLAVVTSTDPDHLDIYGQHEELKKSFALFISQIKPTGHLFLQHHLDPSFRTSATTTYSLEEGAVRAQHLQVQDGKFCFDAVTPYGTLTGLQLQVPGFHNVENALAAIAVALQLGAEPERVKQAISSYRGVKRRFEYIYRGSRITYIDDYAHHPREIEAFLTSVRALYPGRKLTVVFQPHLYTRTRDFAEGFARSLSLADELVLLDIYPARELPIEGVSSEMIFKNVDVDKKILLSKEQVLDFLKDSSKIEVLCTVGAGDIDTLVPAIEKLVKKLEDAVE